MNGSGTDSKFEQQTQNSIKDGNSMKELDDNGPRKNRLLQNKNHVLKINVGVLKHCIPKNNYILSFWNVWIPLYLGLYF